MSRIKNQKIRKIENKTINIENYMTELKHFICYYNKIKNKIKIKNLAFFSIFTSIIGFNRLTILLFNT